MSRGLSESAHKKVLESATELFAENGLDATSVDAIAAASGVSKATIYKHWADKDALCLEVLQYVHELDDGPPEVDSGDLKADLKAFLKYEPSSKKAAVLKRLTPHLIAYSARHEEFGRAWKTRVMDRARTSLKMLLRRGVDQSVFPAALDEDLGVALLLGPMMYRHIFGSSVSLDWLADGAVESFWKAHARTAARPMNASKRKSSQKSSERFAPSERTPSRRQPHR
ncbi:MAG TPA: TetR/AcrR family transcriptional regulator [Candidatus Solibacter sp.]|nr:TetR/AcrR family transcriptional regulator [Candidatus Solibacter sp.]